MLRLLREVIRDLTRPKSNDFASFQPPASLAPQGRFMDRSSFAGLNADEATERLLAFTAGKRPVRAVTGQQKRMVLRKMLRDLHARGLNIAALTPADVALYREWLRASVAAGVISESYASHVVKQWNAAMRLAFGEEGTPGEGLLMRGFRQHVRKVERLSDDDAKAILDAAHRRRFRSEHYRQLFLAFLELDWCCGARVGSLLEGNLRAGDLDWKAGTVRLRHMKNRPEHVVVLTPRALNRLMAWVGYLRTLPTWQGPETPLFQGEDGEPVSPQWMNRALKECAALAGIVKPVTTHVLRKSVGTLIAKQNPRFAREQLGITQRVFEMHYNQPTVEDRIESRGILPGSTWDPVVDEEKTRRLRESLPKLPIPETSAYG